ncbi:uncharacterized protein C1orf232 homolog [Alligator sinensis]|uniref:Uncharacterized protein C1orf232 homolog n=1 Tax=Alligator sinensis TaxID=38654 RepID=A0A3Q0G4Z9_ALLSI|nr:uncharacterized protein C1orf232 homolog [Alligator sinensis]
MTQGFWRLYKSKVLQTLGSEEPEDEFKEESDNPELVETAEAPVLTEAGANPVAQLARRVQGASAKSWRTFSSLFNREDEHQLLTPEPCADHPLAAKPAELPPSERKASGFWDIFATKWQQTTVLDKKGAQPEYSKPVGEDATGAAGEALSDEATYPSNGSDLRDAEEGPFRWGLLASKLAEIRNKTPSKSN